MGGGGSDKDKENRLDDQANKKTYPGRCEEKTGKKMSIDRHLTYNDI